MKPEFNRVIFYKEKFTRAWWNGRSYKHSHSSTRIYKPEHIFLVAKIIEPEFQP